MLRSARAFMCCCAFLAGLGAPARVRTRVGCCVFFSFFDARDVVLLAGLWTDGDPLYVLYLFSPFCLSFVFTGLTRCSYHIVASAIKLELLVPSRMLLQFAAQK